MTKITKPGIYTDIPADDYFADPCPEPSLTQSIAKVLIAQSPAHAFAAHPRLTPPQSDDAPEPYVKAQAIGNAAHLLLIGRGKRIAVGNFDNWRGKEAQAFKAEAQARGLTPILTEHHENAIRMVAAAQGQINDSTEQAFRKGDGEVVLAWQEDGIWLRTMIDWLSPDRRFAFDYKTGGVSFAPHSISFKIDDDGWDVQAAMHERALDAVDPENAGRRRFRFVGQENYEPYALCIYELGEDHLTMGRKKLQYAIDIWRRCMDRNEWPGYPTGILRPSLHPAREARWLDREIAEDHQNERPRIRVEGNANVLGAG